MDKKEHAMVRLQDLERSLKELEEEIIETKKRLPAHSVKPPIMMHLLDLEDRYETLMKQVGALKSSKRLPVDTV